MHRLFSIFLITLFLLPIFLPPALAAEKSVTIDEAPGASGTWTDGARRRGCFNVSVSGSSWSGTVTLQRSFDRVNAAGATDAAKDAAATWRDVATYTANTETIAYEPEGNVFYRIGVANGDYTSGSVAVRVGK